MDIFDVIVIGSGGGSKITRPAANCGYNLAVIEKGDLGGTCLNRGCIPSKMLIHPADMIAEIRDAQRFHIKVDQNIQVDTEKLVTEVNESVKKESKSIAPLYEEHPNITYFHDTATFVSDKVVNVGNKKLTAKYIFIVAGCRPFIPSINGLNQTPYWTSTEALKATKMPKSLIVLGGGYIATELGYYFRSMGVDVTFIVRSEMLRSSDDDIKKEFKRVFQNNHRIIENTQVEQVTYANNQFKLRCQTSEHEHVYEAEQLLVATGITPNTDTLKLGHTDIKLDPHGFIDVNEYLETSVKGVYAYGDIIGRYFFRHTANYEGDVLFQSVLKNQTPKPISYPPIPYAMFTNPQVAGVGFTEKECQQQGIDYILGVNDYARSAMGDALKSNHGFVKLIVEKRTRKLIGAHIIGKEAATLIHMCIAFMNMGATLDDLLNTIYIHPALPEVIRNAARNVS